jgi:hypothetical protein
MVRSAQVETTKDATNAMQCNAIKHNGKTHLLLIIVNTVAGDSSDLQQGVNKTNSKRRGVRSIFNTSSRVCHAPSKIMFLPQTSNTTL